MYYKIPNFLNLIDQLHAHSSPGLSLEDAVGTADPGILGHVLPLVQLLLHLLQHSAVPGLVGHIAPLLWVLLPVEQFPLRSEVVLLERDVPGQWGAVLGPDEDVLEGWREVAVLVYREGRPVVQIVDQCEPSSKAL